MENCNTARKIPPRVTDRLVDLHDTARAPDNLPALKNQLQLAMEMLQQAMEQNLAAERRRMRRMLTGFALLIALMVSGLLAGMGWFMLQIQARLVMLPPVAAITPPPNETKTLAHAEQHDTIPAPAPEPVAQTTPAPEPVIVTTPPPVTAIADMPTPAMNPEILDALRTDLLAVEKRSRTLDDLLAAQNSRLQAIMDDVMNLNNDLQPTPTVAPGMSGMSAGVSSGVSSEVSSGMSPKEME